MNEITEAIFAKNDVGVLSTIGSDGAPWATPVHVAYNSGAIYWVSNSETVHSMNIANNEHVFITVFDSRQTGDEPGEKGALYIKTVARELNGDEATAARNAYYNRYPDRNTEKFNEWSIYSAPLGTLNEAKTKGPLVYYTNDGVSL